MERYYTHSDPTNKPIWNVDSSYNTSKDIEIPRTGDMSQTANSVISRNNFDTGSEIGGHSNRPGDILLQQAPNMEVKLKIF